MDELRRGLDPNPDVVFVFVSPRYHREALAKALTAAFPGAIVAGCTTAGQIGGDGYQPDGITAAALRGVRCRSVLIAPLAERIEDMDAVSLTVLQALQAFHDEPHTFGFLLADGLSTREERLIAALYGATGAVPIVGGSAGDDLAFEATFVLHEGAFHQDAAVLCLVATPSPFALLRFAHHEPTDQRLVITEADPEARLVHEIDGVPAADGYARAVGVPVDALGPDVFSKHPLMLRINEGQYIRAIQRVEPDGSMRFFCAIERGLVMRLGAPARAAEVAEEAFLEAHSRLGGPPDLVLGCDCVLRRLELESLGLSARVGGLLGRENVIGFSTYGEQTEGVHVNQTFVGVALRSAS